MNLPPLSRRRFVQGLASAGAVLAVNPRPSLADAAHTPPQIAALTPATLSGTHFELTVDAFPVNYTGRRVLATGVNGSVPGPTLRWREGDTVTINVTNSMATPTSIHWHGIRLPSGMDGVPGLSFRGIAPGETFRYRFPVRQHGTYWYHSHSGFQEQTGLIGALVIEPRHPDPIPFDRDYVVLLSDWTDTDPEALFSNLKENSDYYNYHRPTLASFLRQTRQQGFRSAFAQRSAWARMNMSFADIADVSGSTYTYLLNGNTPNANWTGLFEPGERIRLRFINGSAMTLFDVRIPGLPMTVVQADGNDVEPVTVDEFRIATAETYDVIVQPTTGEAFTLFAQSEDRTGFARGTLAPRPGMSAAIPPMDPRPVRTMLDMGMAMSSMRDMSDKDMHREGMSGMKMAMPPAPANAASAMSTGPMGDVRMGSSTGTTPFPQPGPHTMPIATGSSAAAQLEPSNPVHLHLGPQVASVAKSISTRLNDPGDGLEHNGRRVLTYADLRARYRGVDGRPPTREIELHLTGNMERFIWGFNGKKFSSAAPIELKLGERVRIVLVNDTMMEHPIHLHGLWSELENGHGAFNPYKHTITVKPAERVSYLVSADTPGQWAYHCHLLYHMHAGMFRTVVVA